MRVGLPIIDWEDLIYHLSTDRPVPSSSMRGPSSNTPDAMPQDSNEPEAGAKPESTAWSGARWDTDIDMPDADAQYNAALPSGSIGELLYNV